MVATENVVGIVSGDLAQENLPLAKRIAFKLHRWYGWVGVDDLHSYAYLGLALAARSYDADRGVPFVSFAAHKAMFLAIDEMRKDGVLKRTRAIPGPTTSSLSMDVPDSAGVSGLESLERRELCGVLLSMLGESDRQLLLMYYVDCMSFKEVAKVFGISESAACLRHKALIRRLRRMAHARSMS